MATNTFDEADTGAGLLNKASGRYARAGKVEEGRGDAVGRGEFIECRSVVPTSCCKGGAVAYGLVGEEGEDVVFPDGAADAAAELVEPLGRAGEATLGGSTGLQRARAVIALVGVEAGAVGTEEEAAVPVVSAGLGGDLKVRSAKAAILGVVAVGDDLDAAYGVFIGGDDRGSTPDGADGADAVDADAVAVVLRTVRNDLWTVLYLEDARSRA